MFFLTPSWLHGSGTTVMLNLGAVPSETQEGHDGAQQGPADLGETSCAQQDSARDEHSRESRRDIRRGLSGKTVYSN